LFFAILLLILLQIFVTRVELAALFLGLGFAYTMAIRHYNNQVKEYTNQSVKPKTEFGNALLKNNDLVLTMKMLSLHEGYNIESASGAKLGEVTGNFLQFPAKFSVIDINGFEVMRLEGKKISTRNQFTFYDAAGNELGMIKKKIAKVIGEEFWVERGGVEFMRIYGDFMGWDYQMEVNGTEVASVCKVRFSWGRRLEISITGEVDHRVVIGAVIVVEHLANTLLRDLTKTND
jgi:uncharacterized protein YxjI